MISTLLRLFTAPKSAPLIDFDKPGLWCIEDEDPNMSLCGDKLAPHNSVPGDEVPDEVTCPECLAVQRYIEKNNL